MVRRSFRAPRRSSLGYRRKKAKTAKPKVRAFPEYSGSPKILGFPGYKAGMTRVIYREDNKQSHIANTNRIAAVTVIETPPIVLFGLRTYKMTPYGLRIVADVMVNSPNKHIKRVKRFPTFENIDEQKEKMLASIDDATEIRALVHTQPDLTGFETKKPTIYEIGIGAESIKDAYEWAVERLGQELQIEDFTKPGKYLDVIGITKGHGFTGVVKRHGITKLPRKTKDGTRRVGSIGPWTPARLRWGIARYGQYGFFRRTEYNKRVMKLGVNGEEITPAGGFIKYGVVRNRYIVVKGSVPGSKKRVVFLRDGMRAHTKKESDPQISYVSTLSNQR